MNNKILILGANGQLGETFKEVSLSLGFNAQFDLYFFSKTEVDICNRLKIEEIFKRHKFDYCINCSAYTHVDDAENHTDINLAINALAVKDLAIVCKQYQTGLIHFSTDYVFDGKNNLPYTETDVPNPINHYGKAKLEGEQLSLLHHNKTLIFRVSWVYSPYGKNFVKTMLRLMNTNPQITVINDQYGSPTYAYDIAHMVFTIIQNRKIEHYWNNIFNYTNEGAISWFEFAQEIKKIQQLHCNIKPIVSTEYPRIAVRPFYSILNKEKFINAFQLPLHPWQESLKYCLKKINNNSFSQ